MNVFSEPTKLECKGHTDGVWEARNNSSDNIVCLLVVYQNPVDMIKKSLPIAKFKYLLGDLVLATIDFTVF